MEGSEGLVASFQAARNQSRFWVGNMEGLELELWDGCNAGPAEYIKRLGVSQ